MTRLHNALTTMVAEGIDGMLGRSDAEHLARLDGPPEMRVVVRVDAPRDRVALISGGGSGHEPAHVGYVGDGMLTAAVAGDLFASPSVDAVLAAILAVAGSRGCLLIVKNYTGDRLNFGLAAERARRLGVAVDVVVVADDVALPNAPQPRGIAGTVLVHKVAGHYARAGADLATVTARAAAVAASVRSIGLALSTCDLPGQPLRSAASHPELGLGIHGEPGAERLDIASAKDAVDQLTRRLLDALPDDTAPLALLLNNLGSVTPLEMNLVADTLRRSPLGSRTELLIGPGAFMTSLNMNGVSLSALPLDDALREALTSAVRPSAWQAPIHWVVPRRLPVPEGLAPRSLPASADPVAERVLRAVVGALIDAETTLNALDAQVGDGDTGSTVAAAMRRVRQQMDGAGLPLADRAGLLSTLGEMAASGMGGSSGALLSIFMTASAQAVAEGTPLVAALQRGAAAMQRYGGAKKGDRTLLDALLPALASLADGGDLRRAAREARAGAEATARLSRAGAGRSAYLRAESLDGVADPGAVAVALAFEAAVEGLGAP